MRNDADAIGHAALKRGWRRSANCQSAVGRNGRVLLPFGDAAHRPGTTRTFTLTVIAVRLHIISPVAAFHITE
jgi:hypothetical protein